MYAPEAVIAEKLHAMVLLDIRNSRMKDFYDIWHLTRTQHFNSPAGAHCHRRPPPHANSEEMPFALTHGFLRNEAKEQQWRGFLRRLRLEQSTPDLAHVGGVIAGFAEPLFAFEAGTSSWDAGGPWRADPPLARCRG